MNAETRTSLVDILILIGLPLLLCVAGVAAANLLFLNRNYEPPWTRIDLGRPPGTGVSILHVDVHGAYNDPSGDRVYVQTDSGAVYAGTVGEKKWAQVQPATTWDNHYITHCAPDWPGAPSDAPIWDPPPVEKTVLDSAGVRGEHSLAIEVRCYVLYQDGTLEVWAREDNAGNSVLPFIYWALLLAGGGAVLGLILGAIILVIRSKRRKAAQAGT